jgi:pilin/secretion family protein with methylation motif
MLTYELPGQRQLIPPQLHPPAPWKCLPRLTETESMIRHETTRRQDDKSGKHSLPARVLRQFRHAGSTLVELLISVAVLALLVLLATQLLNNAATITTLGHKQMDADSQTRELLDRMAIDVMQMVKRSDVYYHLKASTSATDCPSTEPDGSPACGTQAGNDHMAFYSNVPGYYASGTAGWQQSTVSLIGYRINSSATTLANKMERLGAGLIWNGVSTSNLPNTPITFWAALNPWSSTTTATTSTLDIVGPQVFRFEYYYLLKNGNLSSNPWNTPARVRGMQDVAAIITDIAVLDPKSRAPLTNAQMTTLAGNTVLADYSGQAPGVLLSTWRSAINTNTTLPRAALSSIRLYERFLYLSPPTLLTP